MSVSAIRVSAAPVQTPSHPETSAAATISKHDP